MYRFWNYNHLTSAAGRDVIANGWKSAGITKALSVGIEGLEYLDLFYLIDPLVQQSKEMLDPSNDDLNPEELEYFATNYDEGLNDKWEIEETGKHIWNILNVFED